MGYYIQSQSLFSKIFDQGFGGRLERKISPDHVNYTSPKSKNCVSSVAYILLIHRPSRPQPLRAPQIRHRHRTLAGPRNRGRVRRGQHAVAAVGFLVDGDVVRETAEEVEFAFDPTEGFFGRGEDFEVA